MQVNISKRQRWVLGGVATLIVGLGGIFLAASAMSRRFEPYIRQQAVEYLTRRFDSEVQLGRLRVSIPSIPFTRLFMTRGRGVLAEVVGEDIVLRYKGRRDVQPMFSIRSFRFQVDLGRVFDPAKKVALVEIHEMTIAVPPKGERSNLAVTPSASLPTPSGVLLERVIITDSKLIILPRVKDRTPLEFALHRVVLDSVQLKESLRYQARLTNPKPPGTIDAVGTFGPWNTESPSDTPLTGDYTFANADLEVFAAIAGTLRSTGKFSGTLGAVEASGEADVPDFRLKRVGNPVDLHVTFSALVDGTNGNTLLNPVQARLNSSEFTTSGAVVKHDGNTRRTIDLDVNMPNGEMIDLLRLAMKAKPFMAGRIEMKSKIRLPPLGGTVSEKLILDGSFHIRQGQFLMDTVQDKVDTLSRKGQGQPKNALIDNVFSDMSGAFHLSDEHLTFERLGFVVPGSQVDLSGSYDLNADQLDFKGALRLKARVSQTMTGWKRWMLKPVDPFFAKNGAGTYLKIKVAGSSKEPQFGASR